jgi:hypothetical protein
MGIPTYDSVRPVQSFPLDPEDSLQLTPELRDYMVNLKRLQLQESSQLFGIRGVPTAMLVLYRAISMESLKEILPKNARDYGRLRPKAEGLRLALSMFREAPLPCPWDNFAIGYDNYRHAENGTVPPPAEAPQWTEDRYDSYRSLAMDQLALRDGSYCLITKKPKPVLAHIIPPTLFDKVPAQKGNFERGTSGENLWLHLCFCLGEKEYCRYLDEFKRLTSKWSPMQPCENHISLDSDVKEAWRTGLFAVKAVAISEDRKSMTLQIIYPTGEKVDIDGTLDALYDFGDTDHDFSLVNEEIGNRYKQGDTFTITTHDPIARPLPSRPP